MSSLPDLNLSPRLDSSNSYYLSLSDLPLCDLCRTRLWILHNEYEELIRNVNSCPYCYFHEIGMSDTLSNSNIYDADEEDSDSTEYRNAILGIDDDNMSDTSSFRSDIMQDLSIQVDEHIPELISDLDVQETLNSEANDHQVEKDPNDDHEFEESSYYSEHSDVPRYPERSTRSDISSYYETPLRSRFWTKRRNISRTRHGI